MGGLGEGGFRKGKFHQTPFCLELSDYFLPRFASESSALPIVLRPASPTSPLSKFPSHIQFQPHSAIPLTSTLSFPPSFCSCCSPRCSQVSISLFSKMLPLQRGFPHHFPQHSVPSHALFFIHSIYHYTTRICF